jgi:hypothetical protein
MVVSLIRSKEVSEELKSAIANVDAMVINNDKTFVCV